MAAKSRRQTGRKTRRKTPIIRELGDGLVLRHATPDDAEALRRFNCGLHLDPGEPPEVIGNWMRDLFSGQHPTFNPRDFTLVEDPKTGEIVSSLCLISDRWSYGGVEFGVGRPELVATKQEYRRRGLVRAQFEVIHDWSGKRQQKVQAITGIAYFYRQFGYEMALEMPGGQRGHKSAVPKLKKGEKEPFRVRTATEEDVPFISRTYTAGMRRYLVSSVRDRAKWRYEIGGRTRGSMPFHHLRVVESTKGTRVGLLAHGEAVKYGRQAMNVTAYELKPGVSWLAVTPSVLRYLVDFGEKLAKRTKKDFRWIDFWTSDAHPAIQSRPSFFRRLGRPYAFYIRVPDVPDFVRHIAPVLEARLAGSIAAGHSGELKITFYRDGLHLLFARGKLKAAEQWRPAGELSASFPYLIFLQLLFGHRSLEELRTAYSDCWANEETSVLLDILFPKTPSEMWGFV